MARVNQREMYQPITVLKIRTLMNTMTDTVVNVQLNVLSLAFSRHRQHSSC